MTASPPRYELLQRRLALFTRMLHGIEHGRARAVHRARVASRRLRELLPVLQLERDVARRTGRRLRRATRHLGAVRELDALLPLIAALRAAGRFDEAALSRLADAIAQERADALTRVSAKLPAADLRRLAARLEKIAKRLIGDDRGRGAPRAWRWAIEARVRHRAEALKEAIDDAGQVYLAPRVHAVRIALKKFRYAVELKGEVSPDEPLRRHLASLKRTQGVLGRLHDRQVLMDRVRQVQASLTPPNLSVWRGLDEVLTALDKEWRLLHARYVRAAVSLLVLSGQVVGRRPDVAARLRAM